jgi:hypothetical protein
VELLAGTQTQFNENVLADGGTFQVDSGAQQSISGSLTDNGSVIEYAGTGGSPTIISPTGGTTVGSGAYFYVYKESWSQTTSNLNGSLDVSGTLRLNVQGGLSYQAGNSLDYFSVSGTLTVENGGAIDQAVYWFDDGNNHFSFIATCISCGRLSMQSGSAWNIDTSGTVPGTVSIMGFILASNGGCSGLPAPTQTGHTYALGTSNDFNEKLT